MARTENEDAIASNRGLSNAINASDESLRRKDKKEPSYKIMQDTRIPVSGKLGVLWKNRINRGKVAQSRFLEAWNEAERYYNNDQMSHRHEGEDGLHHSASRVHSQDIRDHVTETENLVYANTASIIPTLYSRNPTVEFTANRERQKELATAYERLVNVLMNLKEAPGINIKQPMRRMVLLTQLSNISWMEIGWTEHSDAIEGALEELDRLTNAFSEAKTPKDIEALEGQLMAIERSTDLLQPEGFFRKVHRGKDVIVDPACTEVDLSDANWIAIRAYENTSWLTERYMDKKGEGELVSRFKPTHVIPASKLATSGDDEDIAGDDTDNFELLKDADGDELHGYDDKEALRQAQLSCVWYVWDKTTRRVYLFHDADWKWPIWVWNDPYKLLEFFPVYGLQFHASTSGLYSKGEVTYYLDQQDAINEMLSEERLARNWARLNLFFDKDMGIERETIENVLSGSRERFVYGVEVPEGKTMRDLLTSVVPPSMNFPELFNTDRKRDAINRITAANEALRGGEFRTNTTNRAVEAYQSSQGVRIDEKIDAIEDVLGRIGFGMAQILGQKMTPEQAAALIGQDVAQAFQNVGPNEFRLLASMRAVGGSTTKPTSEAKRREALELGQVLGQFAGNTGAPIFMLIMLQVFRQAFDSIVMKDEHWKVIESFLVQALEREAGANAGTDPSQDPGQNSAGAPQGLNGGGNGAGQILPQPQPQINGGPSA